MTEVSDKYMKIEKIIAQELQIREQQVSAAVRLLDEGNTVPFIARYRKEATGSLTDEQLRGLSARLAYLRGLEERKEQVIAAVREQGKLTSEWETAVRRAEQLSVVEDLYQPYKQKRRTRAGAAREKGLEPLAALIAGGKLSQPLEKAAQAFVGVQGGPESVQEALQGASDILAENMADDVRCRTFVRKTVQKEGILAVSAKDESASSVYEMYYDFSERIAKLPGHRILAIDRGEREKILQVRVELPDRQIIDKLIQYTVRAEQPDAAALHKAAVADGYERLLRPAIEREVRAEMTKRAQTDAAQLFGKNVKQVFMQPPLKGKTVLGWDPAFRTGCKLAVVDPTGKVLDTAVIYPTAPTSAARQQAARETLTRLIRTWHVDVISVGNGTASRESEMFIADFLKSLDESVSYVIVNEAGASVYSASELATEEFPNFDVGQRSAASIARRLQDPLAELVKIDPKSIGVGQYQHDLNQKQLDEILTGVVEECVNAVGVDLNTASAPLLSYVSGIHHTLAVNIVRYREENGPFTSRAQLKKVPKLGPKAFEQSAGFLRITDGSSPLDATSVHPESYDAAKRLLSALGYAPKDIGKMSAGTLKKKAGNLSEMAQRLQIGEPTLADMIEELEKPGRDIRDGMPPVVLRSDVLQIEDLKPGMRLKGTVRNVIDFGAFVDIGVHQDGLVHISEMSDHGFVKHPLDVVKPGDIVDVTVLQVDPVKKRIGLSMRREGRRGADKHE